jgi:hypothetical protein
VAKNLSTDHLAGLGDAVGAKPGDAVFFAASADQREAQELLGAARVEIARRAGLVDESAWAFCWVVDAPMFELTPEVPSGVGAINGLWQVRQEIARLGRPQLPIHWCEGPFLPTNPGALTEEQQEQNHVRYWLLGLAYGVEDFQAGAVASDAGNYYGAEHYGAGIFRRVPLECPKPAAASLATAPSSYRRRQSRAPPSASAPVADRGSSVRARRKCSTAGSHRPSPCSERPRARRSSTSFGASASPLVYCSTARAWAPVTRRW